MHFTGFALMIRAHFTGFPLMIRAHFTGFALQLEMVVCSFLSLLLFCMKSLFELVKLD